jgi:hypothetical protein
VVRLAVRVTPRGGRDAVEGWTTDADGRPLLKVRVAAAATDGQANAAVIALLAKALGRPRSAVRLAAGAGGRVKRFEIEGLEAADLAQRLGPPLAE